MKLNKKTLALCIAATMTLAACGGEDEDSNDSKSRPNNPVTKPDAPDTTPTLENWKEYKAISSRCPMRDKGKFLQSDIDCLRGVYHGHWNDGTLCEIDFKGAAQGFSVTINGKNMYVFTPAWSQQPNLAYYTNEPVQTINLDVLIAAERFGNTGYLVEKRLDTALEFVSYNGRFRDISTIHFALTSGMYDSNYWNKTGASDMRFSYISFNNFNAWQTGLCYIDSVTFY